MLVLDTRSLAAGARAEAFQATVSANCSSSMASFEDSGAIQARMTVHEFGPAKVFNIDASGTTLRRTPRMSRAMTESSVALARPGARADLTAPRQRCSSIAAVARAWGFANPSFFSSRFREAFGVTPRQLIATRPTAAQAGRAPDG